MIEHKSISVLESKLATQIAGRLETAVKKNGSAQLLVSGGSTPIGMYHLLSLKQLDWSKVTVGLVDERYVPSSDTNSNEKMIKENLLINEAAEARFISMYHLTNNEEENLGRANFEYERFHNTIDVCVLGMGGDGHTASLFPSDKNSIQSLENNLLEIVSTRAPKEPLKRISCSKGLILSSDIIYIMITGSEKKRVLQGASVNKLPVSYITESDNKAIEVYYAEN